VVSTREHQVTSAYAQAIEVEHLATVYSRILAISEADILSNREMDEVLKKFSSYGMQDRNP